MKYVNIAVETIFLMYIRQLLSDKNKKSRKLAEWNEGEDFIEILIKIVHFSTRTEFDSIENS